MNDLSFLPFDQLLEQFFTRPGVEAELERRYATQAAILVTDFTEMAARTDAHGIGYALALAAAAWRAMRPVIGARGGVEIKQVADTLFAVFDDPAAALLAALDAQRALDVFNAGRVGHVGHADRNDPIRGCMGLGFGRALVVPGRDVFGPEVNRAFILGEDIARGGEILVTDALLRAVGPLPSGVGAFRAPAEREVEAGCPFHVVADYRDGAK
jgi:class 3 adenylate cyclase